MTRDQKIVGIGAASGVVAMIAAVSAIYQIWPTNLGLADGTSRLVYALQASVFAVLPLLIGIMMVGNDRFSARQSIQLCRRRIGRRRSMAAWWKIRCSSS